MPLHRYPDDIYVCPHTGIRVPKEPHLNHLWRADWLGRARQSREAKIDLFDACRHSLILTCNLLFWSYLKNDIDEYGRERDPVTNHYPAITFPCQDRALTMIVDAIEAREPVLGWKTREMGFSWMVIWTFCWYMLFHENKDFLVMSRSELLVDSAEDPDALFWKIRYLLHPDRMPTYIAPKTGKGMIVDRSMHVSCKRTHSSIDGRATTSHSGAGGRRNAVLLDEFSRVENARALWETLTDTSKARIPVSTPLKGSFFNQLYESGTIKTVFLPWWEHPWKGRGMRWTKDQPSKTAMSVSGWYATAPWYINQRDTRSESDLAENVDCDPKGSRELFFAPGPLEQHLAAWATDPLMRGDMVYDTAIDPTMVDENMRKRVWETVEFVDRKGDPKSPWSLWLTLQADPETGVLRPPQDRAYIMFADIAKGNGASNTVFAVYDVETREQVAEFASPDAPPHIAARNFIAAAVWFGGSVPMLVGWEANGDGIIFGGEVMKLEYPHIYFQETLGTDGHPSTRRYGWNSNRESKKLLVGKFRTEVERQTATVRSAPALREASTYIRYEDDSIGPAELAQDSSGARAAHGDRVIAHSGAMLLLEKYDNFNFEAQKQHSSGSFAYRHKKRAATDVLRRQPLDWS